MPVQSRWYSEPIRLLTIDSKCFVANAKGYPVLPKQHQALIVRYMRLKMPPWILLCNVGPLPNDDMPLSASSEFMPYPMTDNSQFPTLAEASASAGLGKTVQSGTAHLVYMRNLQNKQPTRTAMERFGTGYQDYLQAPLQPLTVNLESITYEVFEKDPIKYEWYEKAIARALQDWAEQDKPGSSPDGRIVVAVVGAGRGPLVTRALQASGSVGIDIDMWALEKNPNAFLLLNRHNQETWQNRVNLVRSDMRTWKGPLSTRSSATPTHHYPIDILISELLGSFADNELSPECLDGITHLLNPTHGLSIPCSYTAFIAPIAAPKLHADISAQSFANPSAPETPFVVMLNAIDHLSTSPFPPSSSSTPDPQTQQPTPIIKPTWSFTHPALTPPPPPSPPPETNNSHNARHSYTTFPTPHRGICHGLAGYFETILYPGVELSTNPNTMESKSAGMISWFPIYFPLKVRPVPFLLPFAQRAFADSDKVPVYVPDESEVAVSMWRQTDGRKVWYEWMVEVYKEVSGTAGGGRGGGEKMKVGMSELHSSVREACLM
ncbi:MAG: hypothetical protein Q9227_005252 [Pyrenula ochraceoflavens]